MCDACKGLAFLELKGLTERQMDAARTLLCTDEDDIDARVDQAIEDEHTAAEQQYEIVLEQHRKVGEAWEEVKALLTNPATLTPETLAEKIGVLDGLLESLPSDLWNA